VPDDRYTVEGRAADRLGARVAMLLRDVYPRHRAKLIAQEFGVSTPTAERWLAGRPPKVQHLAVMAERWPCRFIRTVFPAAVSYQAGRQVLAIEVGEEMEAQLEPPMGGWMIWPRAAIGGANMPAA
jgi:hypothetical protein